MAKFRETLAEAYLARGGPHRASRDYFTAVKIDEMIKICLTPPGAGQMLLKNPDTAERFVFEEAPITLVNQMVQDGTIDTRTMGEAVQLPAGSTWMEFVDPVEHARCGIMVHRQDTGLLLVSMVLELDGLIVPALMIEVRDLPWRFSTTHESHPGEVGEYCRILWECTPFHPERSAARACQLLHDALSCLFLLCVPRICEVRTRTSNAEKLRARNSKSYPAVEFKHVKMIIGVGSPRYEGAAARLPGESLEDHRRRLHRVTWHFRTYRFNRDGTPRATPKIAVVPEHWRGDASKGILLHTRSVSSDKRSAKP
jgi:hypothetical protein